MAKPLIISHWEAQFLLGSTSDPWLFHVDPSDRLLTYPAALGQSYRQEI